MFQKEGRKYNQKRERKWKKPVFEPEFSHVPKIPTRNKGNLDSPLVKGKESHVSMGVQGIQGVRLTQRVESLTKTRFQSSLLILSLLFLSLSLGTFILTLFLYWLLTVLSQLKSQLKSNKSQMVWCQKMTRNEKQANDRQEERKEKETGREKNRKERRAREGEGEWRRREGKRRWIKMKGKKEREEKGREREKKIGRRKEEWWSTL